MEGCDHLAKLLFSPAGAKNTSFPFCSNVPTDVTHKDLFLTSYCNIILSVIVPSVLEWYVVLILSKVNKYMQYKLHIYQINPKVLFDVVKVIRQSVLQYWLGV